MLRILLDASANPTDATPKDGITALRFVVQLESTDLLDILLSKAPTLVNYATRRRSPLYCAAGMGADKAVRTLLAAGAKQPTFLRSWKQCPALAALHRGHSNAVQVFLDEGLGAIGGPLARCHAMAFAAGHGQARLLQIMLGVKGEERREPWANCRSEAIDLLFFYR